MSHITLFKKALLLCLLGFTLPVFSQNKVQNKPNYALLWEISGNGLSKPSYLFGTMHLRDKRVFEFSDSVLLKMAACDVFATEVRMDSAVYQSWETAMSGDTTNRLRNQLSRKGYERLLKALKMKGVDLNAQGSKNKRLVEGWLNERNEADKDESKDLVLDLYLSRLAYSQGKTLSGLERLEDYEDLNDSFFQQFEDSTFAKRDTSLAAILSYFVQFENMIETYNQGDLDSLKTIINGFKSYNGDQHKREMLDNRNVRMIERMEAIMRERTVFCAVGAAHLPDSMGMLTLLRAKGYTVRKVTPQFTGLAEQFKAEKKTRETYHLKDDFNRIELDFPEAPYILNNLKTNAKRLGSQYVYYDITTGALMMAMADFQPYMSQKKNNADKVLSDAFAAWLRGTSIRDVQKEKIMMGEIEGFKFSGRTKDKALVKGRFFMANNNRYLTAVFFDKHNENDTERADAFLNSLKINPLPLTDWQVFEDEKGAFSVKMPIKPEMQELKNEIPNGEEEEKLTYYFNIFMSKEAKDGFVYLVRYSDMPTGMYIASDSTYLSENIAVTTQRFKASKAKIEIDSLTRHYGCPEYNIKITIEGISLFMRGLLRGNRFYLMIGTPPMNKNKENSKVLEDWLNSFRFLPFAQPQLTPKEFPEMGLRLGLPASKGPNTYEEKKARYPSAAEKMMHSTDAQSGSVFYVLHTTYSKYYSIENNDSILEKFARGLDKTDEDVSKSSVRDTVFKGIKAKWITLEYAKSQNTLKALYLQHEGYAYQFSLIVPSELATDAYAKPYFDAIELTGNKEKIDIFSSKKQLIINDLASETDSIVQLAKQALEETEWKKEDLPLLIAAVQKKYPDDTLTYGSVRMDLLNQIIYFKDATTLDILEKLVRTTERDTSLRNTVLCAFLRLDTLNSAQRFFDIGKSLSKLDLEKFYCLNEFMTDSIERAKVYYDKMLALVEKPFEDHTVIDITKYLLNLDTLHLLRDIFNRHTPQYLATANALLAKRLDMLKKDTLADEEFADYRLFLAYIGCFKDLPNSADINQFLNRMTATNQKYLLYRSAFALAKNHQKIDNSLWQRLTKDKMQWFNLLLDLETDTLSAIVPPQYLNQKDIAEGAIRYYLDEDYGEPQEMTFVETQKYKGNLLYVFKHKTDYGSDEEPDFYITICSQPTNKATYDVHPKITMLSESLKDTKGYKKVVEEMLKQFESNKNGE